MVRSIQKVVQPPLIIREMQIKIIKRCYYILPRMAKIKDWQDQVLTRTWKLIIHAGRNVNVNQHFRKHVGIIYQICSNSTTRNMPNRYTCTYATGETYKISQSSAIYNSLKLETYVSIYCRMYDLWFSYQRIQ